MNLVHRKRFPKLDDDCVSELWFDSEEALTASFNNPEGKTLLIELSNFAGDIESALQIRRSPHEHSLSGVNLASEIP